jgi:hypothetical protein
VVEAGKPVAQVAIEHQLHPTLIRHWQHEHQHYAERALLGNGNIYKCEARIAELERLIGQLTIGNALLEKPYCGSKHAHVVRAAQVTYIRPEVSTRYSREGTSPIRLRQRHRALHRWCGSAAWRAMLGTNP